VRRVGVLWPGASAPASPRLESFREGLREAGYIEEHRDDLAEAFAAARKGEAQAINVFASPFLSSLSGEIIGIAAAHRVPTIYQWKENIENGGLVSYGPSLVQLWRQAGNIAAKLLKGAKPAEQPTKFELVVNTRTAKGIGINLPPSLLVRADEVVD